ncbi:hypothetical protein IGI37_000792 [Enterococcus sp. AZ194]|uniref:hypothetical protein n=1 Tax=Enterococcus sp. AZ194 TaxID=2774629 RepID=UPI003F2251B0
MEERAFETLLVSYEGLLRSVLSKCHVYLNSPAYEDYLQYLRIAFFELSVSFRTEALFKEAYPVGYLFQKLRWKIVDLQRFEKHQKDLLERMTVYYQEVVNEEGQDEVEELSLFESIWASATKKEKAFLYSLLKNQEVTSLAKHYKVSPQAIRTRKKRLLNKYFK